MLSASFTRSILLSCDSAQAKTASSTVFLVKVCAIMVPVREMRSCASLVELRERFFHLCEQALERLHDMGIALPEIH